ncbi:hypothetical protein [Aquiflexum gelatinilyticum]|uniref:hypothetical protein n=1 Tax=Aquiflexum gelatinilyticum TaxID=2961943 RepID=UPI002167E7A0|nr:hypothetical protein [Aquiflexum gelatinilyticum]MCS4434376.1 hypothetical protein [Aquiflexum gelatinilyticum]
MKIEISIKDEKAEFFLEVLSNFKYVKILHPKTPPPKKIWDGNATSPQVEEKLYKYERVRPPRAPLPVKEPKVIILPENLSEAVSQIKEHLEGKIKLKPAKDLLNEL